jgi:hypothetical protein
MCISKEVKDCAVDNQSRIYSYKDFIRVYWGRSAKEACRVWWYEWLDTLDWTDKGDNSDVRDR